MADPNQNFDDLPGEELGDFDSIPGEAVHLGTGAYMPLGASAPTNVAEYLGPSGTQQSTGAPAQTFGAKAQEFGGKVLDTAQDFSLGLGQGQLQTPLTGDESTAQKLGRITASKLPGLPGAAGRLLTTRATKAINPFAGGHVGEKLMNTPEAEAGGLAIQRQARDAMESTLAPFSPGVRETAADLVSGAAQVGTEATAGAVVPIPGMNAAGRLTKFVPVLGKVFPKLTATTLGAAEAGVTMPVYGVLGAEDGERQAAIDGLTSKPTWDKVAFMALGGIGAAHANAQQRQGAYREGQAAKANEIYGLGAEAAKRDLYANYMRGEAIKRKVAGIISDEMQAQLANDLEKKVAMEKGEVVVPAEKPALDYEQDPHPIMQQDPVQAAYDKAVIPVHEKAFTAQRAGQASGAARRSSWLKEQPPEFPAHVAITEAPEASFGTRAVIQWVSTPDAPPHTQTFDLNSYADAREFRRVLDKTGVQAEVSFSDKAMQRLWQKNDPTLNDLLMFSAKELKDGKSGAEVKNRNAALMSAGDVPYVESLSSHKVKAQAAENNRTVLIGTKDGPRWGRLAGEDSVTGHLLITPVDEAVGPTITSVASVPKAEYGKYMFEPEIWDLERYFRDNKMPFGADKLLPFGEPAPQRMFIRRAATVKGPVTNTEKTVVDPTEKKWGRIPLPQQEAIAESLQGQQYGFEPAQGGALLRSGASSPLPPGGGGGGGGKKPPGAPSGPEPVPMPERKPGLGDIPESTLDAASGMDKLFKRGTPEWVRNALKYTVGEHLSAPMELQSQVAMSIAANQMERVKGDWIRAQKGAGLTVGNRTMDLALDQVGKGNMSVDEFLAKHFTGVENAHIANQVRSVIESMQSRRDFLHDELVKRGIVHPRDETFSEAGAKKYFARTTLAFLMKPGEWLKMVQKDDAVWNAAKKFLMDQHPDLGSGDVHMMMEKMLNNGDPEDFFLNSGEFGNAASHVKMRQKMPPELGALFGQLVRDPETGKLAGGVSGVYGFAETLAAQEVLYHRALVMDEFAAKPTYALRSLPEGVTDTKSGPYKGWSRMPPNRAQYGALAGMVVHPALKDALVNLPAMHELGNQSAIMRAAKEFSAWTKGNETVLGSGSYYMNNLLGGVQHMMMAGIAPWETGAMVKHFKLLLQGSAEYRANPQADTPGAKFIRDAMRVGADVSGFGSIEITHGATEELTAALGKQLMADKNSNFIDVMTGAYKFTKANAKMARGKMTNFGDAIDRYWRMTTFATLHERYLKEGMDNEGALRKATRDVARAFPMPDRLGVIPDQLRRYTGLLAPYLTYRTEVLRNYAMLPGSLVADPRRVVHLAAWGGVLVGLKKLADLIDPISDDVLRKERNRFAESVNKYRPALVYSHMTGKDGRPSFFDLTPVVEPLRYLQGPPGHPLLNVGLGSVSSITEGGALERYTQQLAGASAPNMARDVAKRKDWNTGALAVLDTAWNDWSMLPKFPQKLYSEYQSTLPQPALPIGSYEQQDPKVAAARAMGLNIVRQQAPARAGEDKLREVNSFITATKQRAAAPAGSAIPGRGLLQGTFGQGKKQDLLDLKKEYLERKKK